MQLVQLESRKKGSGPKKDSLVKKPAHKGFWKLFSDKSAPEGFFYMADIEKRRAVGPVMIPNIKIYRDEESMNTGEEAMVFWTPATIEADRHKYCRENRFNEFNLEHNKDTKDVTLLEFWIIEDEKYDKAWKYFKQGTWPIGTSMKMIQFETDEIWEDAKRGDYNGFSIEGFWEERIKGDTKVAASIQEPLTDKEKAAAEEIMFKEFKSYPWDQCISDRKAEGHSDESAAKICAYIKRKNQSEEDGSVIPEEFSEELVQAFIEHLMKVGQTEQELADQGWTECTEEEYFKMAAKPDVVGDLISNPNEPSFEDTPTKLVRYKYVLKEGETTGILFRDGKQITRNFCADVWKAAKLYRHDDINMMSFNAVNSKFGYYSIYKWAGSFGCRHKWQKKYYAKKKLGTFSEPIITIDEAAKIFAKVVQEFKIVPQPGEDKEKFISRCIPFEINHGHEQSQSIAICESIWSNK
jgi:hypothetical protein